MYVCTLKKDMGCWCAHMRTRWLEFDFLCTYVSFWLCLIHCSVSEDSLPKKTRLSLFAPSPLAKRLGWSLLTPKTQVRSWTALSLAQDKTQKKKKDGKIKPQKSGLAHLLLLKSHIINLIHLSKRQSIDNLHLRWNTPAVHLVLGISD